MKFYTYILKSEKDYKYYYGSTNNLERRITDHNCGKVCATKSRRPLKLHYFEIFNTRSKAIRREHFFKERSGHKWLKENKII